MEAVTTTPGKPPKPSRVRLLLQPAIIRLYKGAGIVALGAILIGLIVFLTTNVFYFFNDNWVRPMILSPNHEKVRQAVSAMADAKLQLSRIEGERQDAIDEQTQLDRTIASDEKFLGDTVGLAATGPIKNADQATIRRQVDSAQLEHDGAVDRKAALDRKIKDLGTRIDDQNALIDQLAKSPYLQAADHKVVVVFVPYENLQHVKPGSGLYGCEWGLVKCSKVGKVLAILDGEVNDFHPHDNTPRRGVLAQIELTNPDAAQWGVLFAGKKPFWFF